MSYLKWVLLAVCVLFVVSPLLSRKSDGSESKG